MSCFNSIKFDQNRPKIKLFLPKKYKIFERWVLCPPDLITAPPIADFCLRIVMVYAPALQSLQFTRNIRLQGSKMKKVACRGDVCAWRNFGMATTCVSYWLATFAVGFDSHSARLAHLTEQNRTFYFCCQ